MPTRCCLSRGRSTVIIMALPRAANAKLCLLSFLLLTACLSLWRTSFISDRNSHLNSRTVLSDLAKDLSLSQNVSTTESTCKKGVRCKLNACCGSFYGGDEGTCGFGPTFCGDDCDSQCDAKAECGKYADPSSMSILRENHLSFH